MNRRLLAAWCIGIILLSLVVQKPADALAGISGTLSISCLALTVDLTYHVSRDNTGTGDEHYAYLVTDGAGNVLLDFDSQDKFNGTDNFTDPFDRAPSANPVTVQWVSFAGNGLPQEVYRTVTITGCVGVGITSFNPADGRVDPRPGDRVAVWCNTSATPPNVVVYGVGDSATNGSHGFLLGQFSESDLLKADSTGITLNAGAGNGTISVQTDGQGHFYVAWNGGKFHATGQGDFAKSFSCAF